MKQRCSSLLVLGLVLLLSSSAQAGPVEALVQVALHPKDPNVMVLRYEYGGEGIFITQDAGASWTYVCNSYIDPSSNARRGMLAVGGDGALMLGVFDGVWRGDKNGCGWSLDEALKSHWVPDIAQDPSDPDVAYAITSNGDPGVVNGILERDASGAWSDLGTKEEMLLTRLRVVKNGEGLRFYESAVKGMTTVNVNGMDMAVPNYIIRVSDDQGQTWQEFQVAAPEMGSFRLQAVDPSNPDRIVAWIDRDVSTKNYDSIMVSNDKGETFSEYKMVTDLGGIAVADDGRVWIADRGATTDPDASRGLWTAANFDTEATQLVNDLSLSCLAYQPQSDKLYACQLRKFGTIDLASGAYAELFSFNKVEHFAECSGADMVATCQAQLCRDYCALGHFPETPMCVAYQTPTCGPCSAIPPAPGCEMAGGAGGAGGSGGSVSGGSGGAAAGTGTGGSGGTTASAGSTGTAGGGAGEPEPKGGGGDGGGCSAVGTGAEASRRSAPWLLAVLALVLGVRRRVRPHT